MSFHDDADLEARLRRIAAGPALEAPPSLYRNLNEVAGGRGARSVNGVRVERVRLGGHRRPGFRSARALAALAAVLLIAVSTAGLLIAIRGLQPAATWTLRPDGGQGEWTGVQWHDITDVAGGIAGPLWAQSGGVSGTEGVVRWSGGFATMGGDFKLWLSSDGLTWRRSTSGLSLPNMVAVRDGLLISGSSSDGTSRSLSFTTDGQTWTPVTPPFDFFSVGLVAGDPGVVAVNTTPNSGIPAGPSVIYFTTDARNWTHASLPSDMAVAGNLYVTPFLDGFVATGEVPDPNGPIGISTDAGVVSHYSYRAWISHDGLHWSVYDPTLPSTGFSSNSPGWPGIQRGPLGAGDGLIYSTDGGVTWLADHDLIPEWLLDGELLGEQTVSDGNRIVMAAGSGERLYVSEGDGHWSRLQQGGDVASLPAAGHLALLPNGVLWITADRVYFGQGLSGAVPQGTIGPPTVASPSGPVGPTPAATSSLTPEPPSSQAPGCTNPPMHSEAAAELVTSGAVIVWERNGGPGCVDELYAAYPDGRTVSELGGAPTNGQVTSARVQAVIRQITDVGFFTDLFFTTYHPPCSACHQHSVTVTYGNETKTVGIVEGGTDGPAQYWLVMAYLSDLFGVAS